MNKILRNKLIGIAKEKISKDDPSHDINHALRVLVLSEKIAKAENADFDIIVPSALFHDIVSYPKNHHKRLCSSRESAEFAKIILRNIESFPKDKIGKVYESINLCSFTNGLKPNFIEGKILQDADSLEATGAISIMRTFSSAGIMKKEFYNILDPFCKKRKPNDNKYALDLFFTRLLIVQGRLYTKTARNIARRRAKFLKDFLMEVRLELAG